MIDVKICAYNNILIIFIKFDIKYMWWYTDYLFVISIKYDFKYLLSTYYSLKMTWEYILNSESFNI
jgi:hypothetical protein